MKGDCIYCAADNVAAAAAAAAEILWQQSRSTAAMPHEASAAARFYCLLVLYHVEACALGTLLPRTQAMVYPRISWQRTSATIHWENPPKHLSQSIFQFVTMLLSYWCHSTALVATTASTKCRDGVCHTTFVRKGTCNSISIACVQL
jgi:hypothetical protein